MGRASGMYHTTLNSLIFNVFQFLQGYIVFLQDWNHIYTKPKKKKKSTLYLAHISRYSSWGNLNFTFIL